MTDAVMEGVRVLEVAEHTFVPAASALLADWGAEIIKIEPAERGDAMRGLASTGRDADHRRRPPAPGALEPGQAQPGARPHHARGRRHPLQAGRRRCDVFLTNKLPRVRKKLKIELDDIRAHNPNIIYVAGTGQGERGPDADKGSYDSLSFWYRAGVALGVKPADMEGSCPARPGRASATPSAP